ncbi:MAG: hypothetical protein ACKOEC_01455 [Acidimicrobiia bacterium]
MAVALVDSLLSAIVRAEGEALVMHVGERPYVVVGTQTINISTHGLNLDAMTGMLAQLLPADALAQLEEFGAVEHRVPQQGADRFTIVAARGGDDVWIEIRRRTSSGEAPKPQAAPAITTPPAPPPVVEAPAVDAAMPIDLPPPIEVPMMPTPAAESQTAAETAATSSQVLAEFLSEPEPIIEYVPLGHAPEPVVEAIPAPSVESIAVPSDELIPDPVVEEIPEPVVASASADAPEPVSQPIEVAAPGPASVGQAEMVADAEPMRAPQLGAEPLASPRRNRP